MPSSEELLWELEPHRRLLEASELPNMSSPAMQSDEFDAMVCAARWTSLSPYVDPDGSGPLDRLPVTSPFHGSIQVDDYQLVPLLKAMRMPRVNLLIADDVGLGKTIEAGLVLSRLLIRRRINRVLILSPASLRLQWRDELWSKFSLPFDVIDRDHTQEFETQSRSGRQPVAMLDAGNFFVPLPEATGHPGAISECLPNTRRFRPAPTGPPYC